MRGTCFATAIATTADDFAVEIAETPEQQREAFRLRHQVYCVERGYEPGLSDVETDEFDAGARHVLLRHRASGIVVGTVRVVLPTARRLRESFPMQRVCGADTFEALPLHTTGELSRFAISKDRRLGTERAGVLIRLALMQGIVHVSGQAGLTHWCAVMERSLLRLLQLTAVHLKPVGPMVEFHGLRQPAVGEIGPVLERIQREQTSVWQYVTGGGRLWSAPMDMPLAA